VTHNLSQTTLGV